MAGIYRLSVYGKKLPRQSRTVSVRMVSDLRNRYPEFPSLLISSKNPSCTLYGLAFAAEATRLHNDANILAMGGRGRTWTCSEDRGYIPGYTIFRDERHIRRINMIED